MSTSQQTLFIGGLVFDGLGKTLAGHGVLVRTAASRAWRRRPSSKAMPAARSTPPA